MLANRNFLVYIILFIATISNAQQASYRFKTWNIIQGLTANTCLSLLQDKQGYIWVGTINGLNRFSGTLINDEKGYGNESEILNSEIRDIVQDNEDVYWLGSFDYGLIKLDRSKPAGQRITLFDPFSTNAYVKPRYSVNRILDDGNGSIWISIEAKGLYRFNKKTGSFIKWPVNHPYSNYAETIRCFYIANDGKLWIGIVNGLIIIDPVTGKTTYPHPMYKGVHHSNAPTIRSFCYWSQDTLAIATDRGAYFYVQSSNQIVPVFGSQDSSVLKSNEYNDVIKFSDHELWFATTDRGLMIINPRTHDYYYAHHLAQPEETVPPLGINRLLKDQSGNIWVAHHKGFSVFSKKNNVFQNRNFLSYIDVPPIQEQITMGANDMVYYCRPENVYTMSPQGKIKSLLPVSVQSFTSVRYISKYPGKGILFQNTSGIFLFDEQKKTVRQIPLDTASLKGSLPLLVSPILDLLPDTLNGKEVVWITGFATTSLYLYEWSNGRLTRFNSTIYSDTSRKNYGAAYTRIRKDLHGGLWLASRKKGIFYIPDRNKDEGYSYYSQAPTGYRLPGDNISDLFSDSKQRLWACIKGVGLVEIYWKKPFPLSLSVFGRNNGLTNMNLKRIQSDARGNLWISSSNGLFCFNPDKRWFRLYTQAHGIRNQAFNFGTCKNAKGELLYTSDDNLLQFNPAEALVTNTTTRLLLREVITTERSFAPEINGPVKLSENESSFTIEFDVLDFENPVPQGILYRLEGYDNQWQMIHQIFQLRYRNVPGGNYKLRLKKAQDIEDTEQQLTVVVHIAKHFYQQRGFQLAVILILIGSMAVALRYYIGQKLRRQQKLFERQQALQAERLRISSELHDDLGGGLSTIYLLAEMMPNHHGDKKNEDLRIIAEKSKELLRNMNEIVWSLNYRNDTLPGLIAYTRQYAVKYLEQAGILLSFTAPLEISSIEVKGNTRRSIFLVVKEALHNIVKHASASKVNIRIEIDLFLSISVEDNGKGMLHDEYMSQSGNGIRNMQDRIQALKGEIELQSHHGTVLLIRIPMQSFYNDCNN